MRGVVAVAFKPQPQHPVQVALVAAVQVVGKIQTALLEIPTLVVVAVAAVETTSPTSITTAATAVLV